MKKDAKNSEEGPHVKAAREGAGPKKFVDYVAFGKALNNYMNEHALSAERLAAQLEYELERDTYDSRIVIQNAAKGNVTTVKAVETIANYLDLPVPYLERKAQPQFIRTPFGTRRRNPAADKQNNGPSGASR